MGNLQFTSLIGAGTVSFSVVGLESSPGQSLVKGLA